MNAEQQRLASSLSTRQVSRYAAAFTLVEIVVTVALVGLLLALVVPGIRRVKQGAAIKQAEADLAMLGAAVEQLAWDTGMWPGGDLRDQKLNNEVWDLSAATAGLLSYSPKLFASKGISTNAWKGPYITRIPTDPWGQPYFFDPDYTIDGRKCVVVGSFGPNRVGRNRYDDDDVLVFVH